MKNIYVKKTVTGIIKYYTTSLKSDISNKNIENVAFLIRLFSKSSNIGKKEYILSKEELIRLNKGDIEIKTIIKKNFYEYMEIKMIMVTSFIPNGSYLLTDNVPKLRNSRGNINTFSAVEKQIGNEIVEDNTVYSNRAIFQKQEGSLTIEERDNLLLERDIELDMPLNNPMQHLKVLQDLNNKAIELEEKKLLPSQ